MPQFEFVWFTGEAFWLLVCFGFLYLIISQLVLPLLDDIFEDRAEAVNKNLEIAEAANTKAAAVMKAYNDFILSAKQEKAEMIQTSYQEIQKFVSFTENENNQALRAKMKIAEDDVRQTQERVTDKSDELAADIAEKLAHRLKLLAKEEA